MSVSLSPTQLSKPYHSNHEFYGLYQDRGERFYEKIIKQEPFELTDGSSVTILESSQGTTLLENKQYKELGGRNKYFKTLDGKTDLSLSQFSKTKEFGSGTGQGAGSKNTALQESTQCVYNALSKNIKQREITPQDITYTSISESYQFVQTTTTLEDVYEFSQNKGWEQSFITSSNILYNYTSGSSYTHHRDSEYINSMYNSARKTVDYQLDKWNPADIWFVKDSALSTVFSSSLNELNTQLDDMFSKQELVGVSLKKLGKEPKIEVKNKIGQAKKQYKYLGYKTTSKSKDISLLYDGGKICFRTFNYATNWAGEILGKTASHGKIGFGAIKSIISNLGLGELSSAKEVKITLENGSSNQIFMKLFDVFIGLEDNFYIFIQEKNIDWRVSKLLGLLLLDRIESQPEDIRDKIISQIINYASSELDESSIFLKLS